MEARSRAAPSAPEHLPRPGCRALHWCGQDLPGGISGGWGAILAREGWPLDERAAYIQRILDFVGNHPESYASLAVCRRALDRGLEEVTPATVERLASHLQQAPADEVEAYYDIVG